MAQLTPAIIRERGVQIVLKVEATTGTDVLGGTYVAADIMPAQQIIPMPDMDEIDNLMTMGDLGRAPSIIGQEKLEFTCVSAVRGKGVAYAAMTVPEISRGLQAAGLAETIVTTMGTESVSYQPAATHSSYTVYVVYPNGKSYQMAGAQADVQFGFTAGGRLAAIFRFRGLLDAEADITFVPGTLAITPGYPATKSAAFQIGTENFAARISDGSFALNNELVFVPSINGIGGVAGAAIMSRNPRLTIDPEEATVATFDWLSKQRAGTLNDCTFQVGTTQYNRILFSFGAAAGSQLQIVKRQPFARGGLMAHRVELLASINAGLDDFKISFT